ncbi:MAG TPA: hypothetical protein VGG39_17020 [Polyangiaceae bacterium]|jgi:hypothetical protein
MRRFVFIFLGLVTACDSSGTLAGAPDASSDATAATDAGVVDPCADAGDVPPTLDCTGLYANFAAKVIAPNAVPYTPSTPLWSDGAQKARWVELPPGTQIDTSDSNEWTFPVGTKFFKEFRVGGHRVETRMFSKTNPGFWQYGTYAWSADESSATLNAGGPVPLGDGGVWTIPKNTDCDLCHRGRKDDILGFEEVGLGLPGAQGLTLAQLQAQGLLTTPPASVSLTIGDDGTGLDGLALGWLHVNCGVSCHNANGAADGSGAGMILRLDPTQLDGHPPDPATWSILATTVNVPCKSGSVAGKPRLVPGDPEASEIYELPSTRQMPPVATSQVDTPDVTVVHAWIAALGQADGGPPSTDAGTEGGGDAAADGPGPAGDEGGPDGEGPSDGGLDGD